jgi:hypothetical protein
MGNTHRRKRVKKISFLTVKRNQVPMRTVACIKQAHSLCSKIVFKTPPYSRFTFNDSALYIIKQYFLERRFCVWSSDILELWTAVPLNETKQYKFRRKQNARWQRLHRVLSNLCGSTNKIRQRTCITFSCHLSLFSITFIPQNKFHSNVLRHHLHTKKSDSNVPTYNEATERSPTDCGNDGTGDFPPPCPLLYSPPVPSGACQPTQVLAAVILLRTFLWMEWRGI